MLRAIEGSIPDMTNPPEGCAFCMRCPYAMEVCAAYIPEEKKISESHRVSCWLMDKRAEREGTNNERSQKNL